MIFLVNDANILIDLLKLDLLETFFQLEYDFQITDIVFSEIQEDNVEQLRRYLEQHLLTRQGFSFAELGQLQELHNQYPGLSIADCSCLYLAEKLEAALLTGDGALRRIAGQRNIEVHGILWLLAEMVTCGLLIKKDASHHLQRLMALNQRLPQTECRKLLRSWQDPP